MGLRGRKVINHSTSIKGPNGVRREEKRRERAGGKRAIMYWGDLLSRQLLFMSRKQKERYTEKVGTARCHGRMPANGDNDHDIGRTIRGNNRPLPCNGSPPRGEGRECSV